MVMMIEKLINATSIQKWGVMIHMDVYNSRIRSDILV